MHVSHLAPVCLVLLCGVTLFKTVLGQQQAVQLGRDCYNPPYDGYITPNSPCTCQKTNPEQQGTVQWVYPNGTIAKQVTDRENKSSTLTAEQSSKYAKNQTYICRIRGSPGSELTYNAKFIFGPESASLKLAPESTGPFYLCPNNKTKQITYHCEVPAATVSPEPVYTFFINGTRVGGYDKLPGKLEGDFYRLTMNHTFNSAGTFNASCHVRNGKNGANWFTLHQAVQVSNQAPPPSYC